MIMLRVFLKFLPIFKYTGMHARASSCRGVYYSIMPIRKVLSRQVVSVIYLL